MSYNSVGRPKFYIDAVLLARQLGHLDDALNTDTAKKFFLNPVNTTDININTDSTTTNYPYEHFINIYFKNSANNLYGRRYLNSLSYLFILGHRLKTDNFKIHAYVRDFDLQRNDDLVSYTFLDSNGWAKFEGSLDQTLNTSRFTFHITGNHPRSNITSDNPYHVPIISSTPIGDISFGWSYIMPQSPDLELTQTFSNESLKVQTTKGGATLTNKGWNQPPKWGIYPQWKRSPNDVAYPTRRSWNLKFSFISDEKLMPQFFNELDPNGNNRGIFERIPMSDDPATIDVDESEFESYSIKDNFLTKVYAGTNGFQLPFIFQPDSNVDEYAICRVNQDSVVFTQVAHRVYDVSLNIIEVW